VISVRIQVSVLGHDPATAGGAWRDRVGVVLQESQPEPGLSVRRAAWEVIAGLRHLGKTTCNRVTCHPG
jgi:ABC-type multidrug transport system ATPase subunit